MTTVNFVLNALNGSSTLAVLATLPNDIGNNPVIGLVDATAVYYISTSDVRDVFRYWIDSADLNDISNTDIKYYIDSSGSPLLLVLNPVDAMVDDAASQTSMIPFSDDRSKNFVKHDYLRYLSLKLFNTTRGVDLFNNESALIGDFNTKGLLASQNTTSIINKHSTYSVVVDANNKSDTLSLVDPSNNPNDLSGTITWNYVDNSFDAPGNLTRVLFRHMITSQPERFADLSSNSPMDDYGTRPLPFLSGDTISFKFSVDPAVDQQKLTNAENTTVIPTRAYAIKIILVDSSTGLNTAPTDSTIPTAPV
jgi:hypothetical protein